MSPSILTTKPESAVQFMADLHGGKETSSFNIGVLDKRVRQYFDRSLRCLEIERQGRDITDFHSIIGGDSVDGSLIYKTHPFHIDKQAAYGRTQVKALSSILIPQYERVADAVSSLKIDIIPGNHGRTTLFDHERNNFDLMLGDTLEAYFANHPKITVKTHDNFYGHVDIRDHGFLVYHGASIRAYQCIPFYGIVQRCMRWAGSMPNPFQYLLMGHFHTTGMMSWLDKTIYLTGTAVTDDEWALEVLGMSSSNRWWFFGVHPEHGISWQYLLDLV